METRRISVWLSIIILIGAAILASVFLGWPGLIAVAAWAVAGYFTVQETEKGGIFFLGRASRVANSGPNWRLLGLEKVKIVPKPQQVYDYLASNVVTKRKTVKKETIGAVEIQVNAALYLRWPDGDDLLTALQFAPTVEHDGLKEFFKNPFLDGIRKSAGRYTWQEVNEDQQKFSLEVLTALKGDDNNPTPFLKMKIDDLDTNISNIVLPPELQKATSQVEVDRLGKIAAKHKAEGEKALIVAKGRGDADARKRMLDVIQEAGTDYEVLLTLREMAQGTSNTILYQFPEAFTNKVANLLGGNDISKLFGQLGKSDQDDIVRAIQAAITKTKK